MCKALTLLISVLFTSHPCWIKYSTMSIWSSEKKKRNNHRFDTLTHTGTFNFTIHIKKVNKSTVVLIYKMYLNNKTKPTFLHSFCNWSYTILICKIFVATCFTQHLHVHTEYKYKESLQYYWSMQPNVTTVSKVHNNYDVHYI